MNAPAIKQIEVVDGSLDSKAPGGDIETRWDRHQFEMKLVNPANKRKYTIIVVGTGLAGALGRGVARRARLQRPELLHPGQPAPRAQHRGAGRHQRRQELPERRRQRLSPVLRHGQGRRLPLARSQRLPAGAAAREHHRPVRRAGRAVRARVRRAARQPLVRRRAGVAHVLRARPDRPAAAARRLSVADAPGRRAAASSCSRAARCSTWSSSTARRAASSAATWSTGEIERYAADAVILAHRRLRHGLLPLDQRGELERDRDLARHKRGALFANPCFTQIHPTCIPVSGEHQSKLTLMSESLRNDGRVWVPKKKGDKRPPSRFPRPSATTTSSASIPRSATSCRATSRRATPSRCATRAAASARPGCAVYLDFTDAIKRLGEDVDPRALRQPVRRCTRRSPTRIRTRCRCGSTRRSTTRWAACGSTTT